MTKNKLSSAGFSAEKSASEPLTKLEELCPSCTGKIIAKETLDILRKVNLQSYPLTNERLDCIDCGNPTYCTTQSHFSHHRIVIEIDKLKSALEEFEKLIKLWSTSEIVYCRVKDDLKKAFPAIYESEVER